jgi:hypothetical protein
LLLPRVLLGEALAEDGQFEAARGVLTAVLTMRSKLPSSHEQAFGVPSQAHAPAEDG